VKYGNAAMRKPTHNKKPRAANFESTPNGLNPPDNCGKLDGMSRVVQTLAERISRRANEIRTATPPASSSRKSHRDLRLQHIHHPESHAGQVPDHLPRFGAAHAGHAHLRGSARAWPWTNQVQGADRSANYGKVSRSGVRSVLQQQ